MNIQVRLFAVLKDAAGVSQVAIEIENGKTIRDAVKVLVSQFPPLAPMVPRSAFAVNQEYAAIDTQLLDGDELALIPPVSGG